MDREKVGDRIRTLRVSKGFTQEKLAELIGIARGSVARYEAGTYYPSQEVIVKLSTVLGVSADYLLGNDEPSTTNISDDDIKFALFGDPHHITDEQFEEVKQFAQFIRERDKRVK